MVNRSIRQHTPLESPVIVDYVIVHGAQRHLTLGLLDGETKNNHLLINSIWNEIRSMVPVVSEWLPSMYSYSPIAEDASTDFRFRQQRNDSSRFV